MELEMLRVQCCFNLDGALTLPLMRMSAPTNDLSLCFSSALKMVITHPSLIQNNFGCGAILSACGSSLFCAHWEPWSLVEKPVRKSLIRCRLWEARKKVKNKQQKYLFPFLSCLLFFSNIVGKVTQRSLIRCLPAFVLFYIQSQQNGWFDWYWLSFSNNVVGWHFQPCSDYF